MISFLVTLVSIKETTLRKVFSINTHSINLVELLFQVILLVYCVKHGNVYRVLNGYDNCTNVCGFMSHYKANGDNRYDCRKRDFKQHKYNIGNISIYQ